MLILQKPDIKWTISCWENSCLIIRRIKKFHIHKISIFFSNIHLSLETESPTDKPKNLIFWTTGNWFLFHLENNSQNSLIKGTIRNNVLILPQLTFINRAMNRIWNACLWVSVWRKWYQHQQEDVSILPWEQDGCYFFCIPRPIS